MKKLVWIVLFFVFLAASFWAGSRYGKRDVIKSGFPATKPSQVGEDAGTDISSMPSGTVKISPERQQTVGVRIAQVEKKPWKHVIRTSGRVVPDETRLYRLIAPLDGWILETFDNSTGSLVKKNEPLASYYSLDILTAQQNYLSATSSLARLKDDKTGPPPGEQTALARTRTTYLKRNLDGLRSIGMSDVQIKEFERTREFAENILIVAPAESFILSRNVSLGQRFEKGTEWYRLADLGRVWILADLFENESQYIKPGVQVRITIPHQRKEFHATVSKILPQFDAASRTLKVRLEMDNPNFVLRPDMFVDAEFPVSLPSAIFVPVDAVLDSGLRKTIFIDRGNGFLEPRKVETGWRMGDRIEITAGLQPGERIVVSGNFLIDSESRMQLAAAGIYGTTSTDPVCGMETDEKKARASGRTSTYQGTVYYFCANECKETFDKRPGHYVQKRLEGPPSVNKTAEQSHSQQAGGGHD